MLTEVESGMCKDQVSYSYKRQPEEISEKLYVGHLPFAVSKRELDDLFGRYGPLANIEIKHGGYAFIQYENPRDAEDAVRALHNYMFEGRRLTVEFSNKKGTGGNACLLCGVEGHWARECPENKEKGLDVKSGKCFKCGGFGHLARFCREAKIGDRPPSPRFRPISPRRRRSRSPYRQEYGYRRRSPSPRYDYYRGGRGYSPVYYRDYPDRDYYRYEDEYRYRERELEPRDGARDRDLRLDGAVRDPRMETARDPRMETMERPEAPRDPREGVIGRDSRDPREAAMGRDPREGAIGRDSRDIRERVEGGRDMRDPREPPRDGRDPRLENRDFDPRRADYYYGFNRDQYLKR